jgi:hypothetical protein
MRPSSPLGFILALAVVATGDMRAQTRGRPIDMATADSTVIGAVARADIAILELQTALVGRLRDAMSGGGPAAAVRVCRDEAQALTAAVGARHRLEIGRTSDRLRNPANAPRPWADDPVASHAGEKAAGVTPVVVELDGRVGVLKPIGTLDFCVTCHGPRDVVNAAIGDVLKTAYPQDQAVGFATGDLRGWFWVEVALN